MHQHSNADAWYWCRNSVHLSVCLSICLSHSSIVSKWLNISSFLSIWKPHYAGFSSTKQTSLQNSDGSPPTLALNTCGVYKFHYFWPIYASMWETIKIWPSYYQMEIGIHMHSIDLYHFWWPRVTFIHRSFQYCCYFSEHSWPTICQQQLSFLSTNQLPDQRAQSTTVTVSVMWFCSRHPKCFWFDPMQSKAMTEVEWGQMLHQSKYTVSQK